MLTPDFLDDLDVQQELLAPLLNRTRWAAGKRCPIDNESLVLSGIFVNPYWSMGWCSICFSEFVVSSWDWGKRITCELAPGTRQEDNPW